MGSGSNVRNKKKQRRKYILQKTDTRNQMTERTTRHDVWGMGAWALRSFVEFDSSSHVR